MEKTSSLKSGVTALKLVAAVGENVLEMCEYDRSAGRASDEALVAGDVVTERRQSRSGDSLDCAVLVVQQIDDQTEVETWLSKDDLGRRTVTCHRTSFGLVC